MTVTELINDPNVTSVMTKEQWFILDVVSRLPKFQDVRDLYAVEAGLSDLFRRGFSVHDAVLFCICMQEVDPSFDEALAIERMNSLFAKYGGK